MESLHRGEHGCELVEVLALEASAEGGILGHVGEDDAFEQRLHIEPRAAHNHCTAPAGGDAGHGTACVAEVFVEVVAVTGGGYVEHMHGHAVGVFAEVLAGADVHSSIHLPGVGADNLAVESTGQQYAAARLAARRGPDDGYGALTHRPGAFCG